ncbi:MAG: hypothetical protein DRJ37_04985 [Thermoprotei archaeon]|nr:MAG: hypothetical protein DRJ37_04985 [Thermoprotei archaeon]
MAGRGVGWVDFPPPHRVPGLELSDCVIVELSPSRGYKIVGENLLIDHHGFVGVKRVFPGGEEVLYEAGRGFRSVAGLIAFITGFDVEGEWRRILDAVDLIDEGRSREDSFAWMLHSAYLYNIEDIGFRKRLFELLVEGRFVELFEVCRRESAGYERARGRVSEIVARAVEVGEGVAFTWYLNNVKDERVVFREAMFELEKDYGLVVVASVRGGRVYRLHLGSMGDRVDSSLVAERIAERLRGRGFEVAAGGRRNAAGVQILSAVKPSLSELLEILKGFSVNV